MGEFPNKSTQFKPGNPGGPGRPKGSIDLATRIRNMLDDPDFTTTFVVKGKKVEFKGNPAEAIIRTAVLKSMGGDTKWAEWLAKHGYGTKQIHEIQNTPIKQILEKYGLTEPDKTKETSEEVEPNNAGQTESAQERPPT